MTERKPASDAEARRAEKLKERYEARRAEIADERELDHAGKAVQGNPVDLWKGMAHLPVSRINEVRVGDRLTGYVINLTVSQMEQLILGYTFPRPDDPRLENREPWQEAGWKCRFTKTGICVANVAEACRFPHCGPLPIDRPGSGLDTSSPEPAGKRDGEPS